VASLSIQLFGHNRHVPKVEGAVAHLTGELGPNLTRGLGRGLPPYQVAS